MNDERLLELAKALQDALAPQIRRSESARRAARLLGEWLLEQCRDADAAQSAPATAPADVSSAAGEPTASTLPPDRTESAGAGMKAGIPEAAEAPSTSERTTSRAIVPLKIGDASVLLPVEGTTEELGRARQANPQTWQDEKDSGVSTGIDLSMVERRCRLKAESCRLFIERRAAAFDPIAEPLMVSKMNEMIASARALPNCFLWVFWKEREQPDDKDLRTIARCYEALADAVALTRKVLDAEDETTDSDLNVALQLLAETDSALLVALGTSWLTAADVDQDEVHTWLRDTTWRRGIYLERFMKISDPADPGLIDEVIEDVARQRQRLGLRIEMRDRANAGFRRIRYHAEQWRRHGDYSDGHDLRRIVEAIGDLGALDVPTSDSRYVEAIGRDVALNFRGEVTAEAAEVLAAVLERTRPATVVEVERAAPETAARWSDRILQVRTMLSGRQVVIVGGEPRAEAMDRIKDAFELAGVNWVRLTEHGSGDAMRAPIARPETALVIVLVKLTGHLHAEEAGGSARAAGKPCVFLPAGYNPEQIAHAVLEQVSRQLA